MVEQVEQVAVEQVDLILPVSMALQIQAAAVVEIRMVMPEVWVARAS
jgi:hypothetical protein